MKVYSLPEMDISDNPTNCCPRFKPDNWDAQQITFKDKPFVRATTRSIMYIPLNMGSMMAKVQKEIEDAGAGDSKRYFMLSHDNSMWQCEHLFWVTKDVPGQEMIRLSGDFATKVFEGPFKDAGKWVKEMQSVAHQTGRGANKIYFFYTTCPKCAKVYGKNYVVGFAELGEKVV